MVDCIGKRLNVGDKVVCSDMRYADLLIGEIIGFTPKKARVRYERSEYFNAYGQEGKHEQLKESYQIFKYEEVQGEWLDANDIRESKCSHCGVEFAYVMGDCCNYCPSCGMKTIKKEQQCQKQNG